jgi:hypothetical protein
MPNVGEELVRGGDEILLKRAECLVLRMDTPKGCFVILPLNDHPSPAVAWEQA